MTINADIQTRLQSLQVGEVVEMFELDTTHLGGSIYYFTPNTTASGQVVEFNGVVYSPVVAKVDGLTKQADGAMARPTLTVGNLNRAFTSLIYEYNNLLHTYLTIRRTFSQFLDDGISPGGEKQLPPQTFRIERKVFQDKASIQWELTAIIDDDKKMVPRRQCVPESCAWTYRIYSGGSFDYTDATCPYTGTDYFTELGEATTAANDVCGKRLYDCRLRYGITTKPYGAFPGVGKVGREYR